MTDDSGHSSPSPLHSSASLHPKLEVLRDLLDHAEASGISERSFPEIMELARQEAQRKGIPHERN
ncbi:MAG: hypothetical protein OXI13_14395 [Gammaproteobacteria bacterium]|nr:hypothetical protein [Gammaproteobacteria bacterium]MYA67765.1 hypothetical protein [Gammaproteobacteria bacterium]MYH47486.1 hypothetical protein [Gammaproteobacteria bacterium]MYL12330.1 hypothetical protein [Gammaproteobacteria bacterium]